MELPPNFDKLIEKLRHDESSLMVSADGQVSSVPLYQFQELKSHLMESLESCKATSATWTAQGVQFIRGEGIVFCRDGGHRFRLDRSLTESQGRKLARLINHFAFLLTEEVTR